MTYRFTVPLEYTDLHFSYKNSSDLNYLKNLIGKKYNGSFHIYEFIKIKINLYESKRNEPKDQAIMTPSSLTDLSKLVVKTLKGIAYDSINQVVSISADKYNGEIQKVDIEVIAYEE